MRRIAATFSHKGRREEAHRPVETIKNFSFLLSSRPHVDRLKVMDHQFPRKTAIPTLAQTAPVSKPALWLGRVLSGLVILFMLFDGAIKLVPWPVVTETMDRIGYGSKLWREAWVSSRSSARFSMRSRRPRSSVRSS